MDLTVVVVLLALLPGNIGGSYSPMKTTYDSLIRSDRGLVGDGSRYQVNGGVGSGMGYRPPYQPQRQAPLEVGYGGHPCRNPPCISLIEAELQNVKCSLGFVDFIAKLELMILQIPKEMIGVDVSVPAEIISRAKGISEPVLQVCQRAKDMLISFVGTIFEIPAKVLMGSAKLYLRFLQKFANWSISCEGYAICQQPLPVVHGLGPCAGQWPCTLAIAQKTY